MSEVFDAGVVRILLADYGVADAQQKLNVIGGGLSLIGFNAQVGLTAPFAVVVWVTVPPALYDQESAVEILLEDNGGELVELPGPAGSSQAMRVGHVVTFERPTYPGSYVPNGLMAARAQLVLTFNTGLPLTPGQRYSWSVRIDHETRPDWTEEFYVPGPPPGPVVG